MKTDRFDDEFRQKLQGLPTDVAAGEADRVHTYVQTHWPTVLGVGWNKRLIVGGCGLLLVASLLYNLVQSYRNTHLQASLDSLTQRRVLTETVGVHDTVYVTRYADRPGPGFVKTDRSLIPRSSQSSTKSNSTINNDLANELALRAESPTTYGSARTGERRGVAPKNRSSNHTTVATDEEAIPAVRSLRNGSKQPSLALTTTSAKRKGRTSAQLIPDSRPNTPIRVGVFAASQSAPETINPTIRIEAIAGRQWNRSSALSQAISTRRLRFLPDRSVPIQKMHRPWHLTLPTLSVPNAAYRIGASITGADDQLGGGLLGEIALNQHWSLQTGVRMLYSRGFHYRNERDFDDNQDDDFRQKYASQLPSTAAIEDINLQSIIAQVPIQIAYHYPLSKQWRLRLGVGTDLDLFVRSSLTYKYQGSGRMGEQELTHLKESAWLFNNLTISPSVEWYWKRWLLRGGPFISPQLRSVSYKPDDLSWGANIQLFYRLGK